MTEKADSQRVKRWYDHSLFTVLGAPVLVGIALSGTSVVIKSINPAKVPWWIWPLAAVAGVIVATFALPVWRRAVWGKVCRLFIWIRGLKITSRRMRIRLSEEMRESLTEQLNAELGETLEAGLLPSVRALAERTAELQRRAVAREVAAEVKKQATKVKADLEAAYRRGVGDGEVWRQPPLPPVPQPRPRWRVFIDVEKGDGQSHWFVLDNSVDRSVAKEVRIDPVDAHSNRIQIGGGHWQDLSGKSQGGFSGQITDEGGNWGVRFDVSWYDETNEQKWAEVTFPGSPPPASGSVWSVDPF